TRRPSRGSRRDPRWPHPRPGLRGIPHQPGIPAPGLKPILGDVDMMALNAATQRWVDGIRKMTTPDNVVVCDGSEGERDRLTKECLASGELIELNQKKLPGCYLHRSASHDVARTEHLTFVCTRHKEDAGPN